MEPRELERLPTKEMFFKGIFLVIVFGGDLDPSSSDGDDLLVAKKLRFFKSYKQIRHLPINSLASAVLVSQAARCD